MSANETYRAFLLRLWREAGAPWRASLEDPHTGKRLAFSNLEQLAEYLVRATEPGFASGAPDCLATTGSGSARPPNAGA